MEVGLQEKRVDLVLGFHTELNLLGFSYPVIILHDAVRAV